MKEVRRKRVRDEYIVRELDLQDVADLVDRCNQTYGPLIEWDDVRGCYGLKADRSYKQGELVTTYSGAKYSHEIYGDYVTKAASDIHIDGRVGFKLSEKGRWINESDRDRRIINVSLGRSIRATRDIEAGEWLFTDYGPDYIRNYK